MEYQQVTRTGSTGEALLVQGRDEVKIFIIFLLISCDDYFCQPYSTVMATNGSIGLNCLAYQYCKLDVNKSRLKYLIQVF